MPAAFLTDDISLTQIPNPSVSYQNTNGRGAAAFPMAGQFSNEYVCQISGRLVPPAPALQFSHSDYSSSSSGPPTPPGETIDSYASPMSIDAETPRLPSVKTYADATNVLASLFFS